MKYTPILTLGLLSLIACSDEFLEKTDPSDGIVLEFDATQNTSKQTRVAIQVSPNIDDGINLKEPYYNLIWSSNDELSILPQYKDPSIPRVTPPTFYLKSGSLSEDQRHARFQGVLPSQNIEQLTNCYAVWPALSLYNDYTKYPINLQDQFLDSFPSMNQSLLVGQSLFINGALAGSMTFEQQTAVLHLKLELPESVTFKKPNTAIELSSSQLPISGEIDFTNRQDQVYDEKRGYKINNLVYEPYRFEAFTPVGSKKLDAFLHVLPTQPDKGLSELTISFIDENEQGVLKYNYTLSLSDSVCDIIPGYVYTVSSVMTQSEVKEGELENFPIEITEAEQLVILSTEVAAGDNKKGIFYRLAKDIDLSTLQESFQPIGGIEGNPFSGNFNGNNRKITGLKIDTVYDGQVSVGLFGMLEDGYLRNLTVQGDINVNRASGGDIETNFLVGGVAGKVNRTSLEGTITSLVNITVRDETKTTNGTDVGGLFGVFAGLDNAGNHGPVYQESTKLVYGSDSIAVKLNAYATNQLIAGGIVGRLNKIDLKATPIPDGVKFISYADSVCGNSLTEVALTPSVAVGGLVGRLDAANIGLMEGIIMPSCKFIHAKSSPITLDVNCVTYAGGLVGQGVSCTRFNTFMPGDQAVVLAEISDENGGTCSAQSQLYVARIIGYSGVNTARNNQVNGVAYIIPERDLYKLYEGAKIATIGVAGLVQ